ncbi:YidC/Oxa1 family insertase periplasmic-domain containing protein [Anatilimnocola floriformis]|uniref:YidC/Oxa1 family insertase periplasmic-domain containing protein n=1 Tax=Anatilimnocola floriformis TaxID=2948575 RepID=UPI0020C3E190|nr:YidC/Oxa1 family insertase periplasmic-domain containing protein [Anatilimnocola floriformis]
MDRRFVTFLVVTFLIWTAFLAGKQMFAPPKPIAKNQPKAVQPADDPAEKPADPDAKIGDPEKTAPEKTPTDPPATENPSDPKVAPADTEPRPAIIPRQRVMIGSLDPKSPYGMLVTLDSQGAAVERVELTDPRYKDIEDLGGYCGHLGFEVIGRSTKDNVIQTVGPGTPAASAVPVDSTKPVGLKPGDVIRDANGTPIERGEQFEKWLHDKTKPGQSVEVTVDRVNAGKVESLVYKLSLIRRPLEMIRPETRTTVNKSQVTDPLSFLLSLETLQGVTVKGNQDEIRGLPSFHESNWELGEQSESSVVFTKTLTADDLKKIGRTGSLKVTKRYSVPQAAEGTKTPAQKYHLDLAVGVENTGDEQLAVAYRLDGPNGIPLEGWWYSTKMHRDMFKGAGARDVLFQLGKQPHHLVGTPLIYDHAKKAIKGKTSIEYPLIDQANTEPMTFTGVDAQFFAAMIIPKGTGEAPSDKPIHFARAAALPMHNVEQLTKTRIRTTNTSVRLVTARESVDAGQSLKHHYQVFLGPKDPEILKPYGLESIIEYGWQYAAYPAKMLAGLLHWLYAITGNYGVSIVLLTVLVRTCMLPFSIRQARSAKLMQEISAKLKPELNALKEKYKDDPLKQHQATSELMKKHGMPNPMAGCLLVFFQLPVFVGLYRCLSVDINLRDANLFSTWEWASNLAGPDKLFYWQNSMPSFIADPADGWLGPFFNVFPLITIALFILQQKLFTPPPTDEQQEMQQQMMFMMSLMMGVFFYKVPAGLCLYFITSSLWSVAERTLLPKSKPVDPNTIDSKVVAENKEKMSARTARREKKKR